LSEDSKQPEKTAGNSNEEIETKRHELFFNLASTRYKHEVERRGALDTKASSMIGYVTIVTGIMVGVGSFNIISALDTGLRYLSYFLGIGALVVSILASMLALRIRDWITVPEEPWLETIWDDPTNDYRDVLKGVGTKMLRASHENGRTNDKKSRFIKWSWYFLVGGIAWLVIFVGIFAATGGFEIKRQEPNPSDYSSNSQWFTLDETDTIDVHLIEQVA
jgi:hypothetical protein